MFCRTHEQAPNAQRGGWLSAERRRRKLAAGADPLDVSNVVPRLWIGAAPPTERDLPDFDMLVLCASEIQPERVAFHGQLVRCPVVNDILSHQELAGVIMASRMVAQALGARKRVLVTCTPDTNRSALIAALALARLTRASAAELTMLMRAKRPPALGNAFFQHVLQKLVGDGRNPYR